MRFTSFLLFFFAFQSLSFTQTNNAQQVVSGIIMVNDNAHLDTKALLGNLNADWKVKTDSVNSTDKTLVFSTNGATVMVSQLHYPADPIEIRAAAQLSWMWRAAVEEALPHQSQVLISVIGGADKSLELYQLFTKVAGALLENTNSCGVFMNSQYLLIPKGFYSAAAHNMLDNQTLPIYCWIYFGMPGDGGGYTFGMEEFGLREMEIVKSSSNNVDVHATLYDAAASVLKYNSRPTEGEFIVTEEGTKIPVRLSKGVFLEGHQVLQLQF